MLKPRRFEQSNTLEERLAEENAKPSREDEARQVVHDYADDQREIIKKLRKPTN